MLRSHLDCHHSLQSIKVAKLRYVPLLHFENLLHAIADNPEQHVFNVPIQSEKEQYQILHTWNRKKELIPPGVVLHKIFEKQVEKAPDAAAVSDGTTRLSYRELNERANQLAHYLRKSGVTPDVLVGVSLERSVRAIITILAVWKAGGAYLPLDPDYPKERLHYILRDADLRYLITQKDVVGKLPVGDQQIFLMDADWPSLGGYSTENPENNAQSEGLAYVIYTSGSTGRPKGVPITHRAMMNLLFSAVNIYGVTAKDRILQFSSISFDATVEELFSGLISGSSVVLRADDDLLKADGLGRLCEDWGISVLPLPTSFWHQLGLEMSAGDGVLPESLRMVITGGEAARVDSTQRWVEIAARSDNPPRLVNGYGPTETTVVVTSHELMISDADTQDIQVFPIGRPTANTMAYILDPQMQLVPIGVPGELHIGGVQVARGYLNRPDLTSEKFIKNPFSNDPDARRSEEHTSELQSH